MFKITIIASLALTSLCFASTIACANPQYCIEASSKNDDINNCIEDNGILLESCQSFKDKSSIYEWNESKWYIGSKALRVVFDALPSNQLNPTLSKSSIMAVIETNTKDRLKQIYDKNLKRNRHIQGKIIARITIDPNGSVLKLKIIETEITDHKFIQDISNDISKWQFKKSTKGATVTIPFTFSE